MGTNPRRPSLLKQHEALLGFASSGAAEGTAEQSRIDGVRLAPLALPVPLRQVKPRTLTDRLAALADTAWNRVRIQGPRLMAAAACGALLAVFVPRALAPRPDAGDRLRPKGTSQVWIYWERDGNVQPWSSDSELRNGDRVRAEVLAGEESVAFLGVENREGQLLSDPAKVQSSAMPLAAGDKKTFAGSIKLVGADEGETLVVVVCRRGTTDAQVFNGDTRAVRDGCSAERFPLRGP